MSSKSCKSSGAKAPARGEHQNTARMVMVLDTLAGARDHGMRLTDVVAATGLGVAVVHRLLNGLVAHRMVDFHDETNRYMLGLKLISLTAAAAERYGLARFVEAPLNRLVEETADTVYFSLRSGDDAVCVDRREGAFPIRTLTLKIGDFRPLGIGAGSMALLAFQSDERRAAIVERDLDRRESFGIADDWLVPALDATRVRGFSLNDGQLIQGMSGIGVPVCKSDGTAIAALSVAAITDRLSGTRLDEVAGHLFDAARQLELAAADIINSPMARRYAVPGR